MWLFCLSDRVPCCCHMQCQTMRCLFIFIMWLQHCWPADWKHFQTEALMTFNWENKWDSVKLPGLAEKEVRKHLFLYWFLEGRQTHEDRRQTGQVDSVFVSPSNSLRFYLCLHVCYDNAAVPNERSRPPLPASWQQVFGPDLLESGGSHDRKLLKL